MFKDNFSGDLYNMTLNLGIKKQGLAFQDKPETLDPEDLAPLNEEIRRLSEINPDCAPSFVSKDKIAFMSSENIILIY